MRRYLQPRRPIGARRAGPPCRAPTRPRRAPWNRSLTLIFRQRRAPAVAPAPRWRNPAGQAITIAPRLQLILRLWTSISEDHRHAATDVAPAAAADLMLRSSHLHIHRHGGARGAGRAVAVRPGQRAAVPALEKRRAAGLRLRSGAARSGRGDPVPPARALKVGARAPGASARTAPAGATPASRRQRLAAIAIGIRAGPRSRAAPARDFVTMEMPGARRRSRDLVADSAPAHFVPRPAVVARRAQFPRPAPARLVVAPPPGGRPVSSAAAVRRDHPATMLELPGVARARGASASAAASHRSGEAPPRLPAPLDYRRPAPTVAAEAVEQAPSAAPPPQPPVIDMDALSRDVISRIEQRLRIERERHGRV